MIRLSRVTAAVAVGLTVLAGCSGSDRVSVSGAVTMDGQPYGDVYVTFHPEDGSGIVATGIADEDGKFKMGTTDPGDGVKPGKYKVTLSPHGRDWKEAEHPSAAFSKKQEEDPNKKMSSKDYTKMQQDNIKAAKAKKSPLPNEYLEKARTPLTVSVPEQRDVKIELSSKPK